MSFYSKLPIDIKILSTLLFLWGCWEVISTMLSILNGQFIIHIGVLFIPLAIKFSEGSNMARIATMVLALSWAAFYIIFGVLGIVLSEDYEVADFSTYLMVIIPLIILLYTYFSLCRGSVVAIYDTANK